MAETITVRTRFQHRRGLAEQWKALNPVLLDGEWGYEKDTRLFKVGDGVTAWNALPYAGYILPVASASVLGGVTAAAKGSGDTVEVKIDAASRRLFVPTLSFRAGSLGRGPDGLLCRFGGHARPGSRSHIRKL